MGALLVGLTLGMPALGSSDAAAQSLEDRVRDARADVVSFRYATHPDVQRCDGSWNHRRRSSDSDWEAANCWTGPAEVRVELRDGAVRDLDVEIVREDSEPEGGAVYVGVVQPQEATDYLFGVVRTARSSAAEEAVGAAAMADGVVIWPELLDVARSQNLNSEVRQSATFWLGQATVDEALDGLRGIVEDDPDVDVRESAVFALSQRGKEEAVPVLMEIAEGDNHPEVRQAAFFWLSQFDDPRVLALFERILLRGGA